MEFSQLLVAQAHSVQHNPNPCNGPCLIGHYFPKAHTLYTILGPNPDAHVHAIRIYGNEHELMDFIWSSRSKQGLEVLSKHAIQNLQYMKQSLFT